MITRVRCYDNQIEVCTVAAQVNESDFEVVPQGTGGELPVCSRREIGETHVRYFLNILIIFIPIIGYTLFGP